MFIRPRYSALVLNILLVNVVFCYEESKSSLTFVIDDTISMQSDIRGVLKSVDEIFNAVQDSPKSTIGIFNIVTFGEDDAQLIIKTADRKKFKKSLAAIHPHGGGDCPETTFHGIERGLKESKKDSYILVYTDASSKDEYLYEKVKNLALDLNVKIIFLLTNSPCLNDTMKSDKFFNELAAATDGQVFQLAKKNLYKVPHRSN